jgi:hypothetical protein
MLSWIQLNDPGGYRETPIGPRDSYGAGHRTSSRRGKPHDGTGGDDGGPAEDKSDAGAAPDGPQGTPSGARTAQSSQPGAKGRTSRLSGAEGPGTDTWIGRSGGPYTSNRR